MGPCRTTSQGVQHVDYFPKGRATGFVIPESVRESGGGGSLLNHSEHRISEETIGRTMVRARKIGLKIILCCGSVKEAQRLMKFKPWAMAFEDARLVGSGKSITDYRGKDVGEFVKVLKRSGIIPLCGAGINDVEDVLGAKKLGCKGVLISSAVANDNLRNVEKFLRALKLVRF